jgi:putative hemolysin
MSFNRLAVAVAGMALGMAALALVAALQASPSEAQQGTLQNCPSPGKWSTAVWTGDNGTDASEAFSSCNSVVLEAAYSLDPETQMWSRWFLGEPEVSNLSMVNDKQGVLALGSTQVPPSPIVGLPNPASVYCAELGFESKIVDEPEGQVGMCVFPDGTECEEWSFFEGECGQNWALEASAMRNCPQTAKWAIAVWDGANGADVSQALSYCGEGAIEAAYSLDSETQTWSRWFANNPEISNLSSLDNLQGLMMLGAAAAPAPTSTPSSGG